MVAMLNAVENNATNLLHLLMLQLFMQQNYLQQNRVPCIKACWSLVGSGWLVLWGAAH